MVIGDRGGAFPGIGIWELGGVSLTQQSGGELRCRDQVRVEGFAMNSERKPSRLHPTERLTSFQSSVLALSPFVCIQYRDIVCPAWKSTGVVGALGFELNSCAVPQALNIAPKPWHRASFTSRADVMASTFLFYLSRPYTKWSAQ